jgi:hypothetical protein
LELIPVALESLTFGKCVWDGGWFDKPSFKRDGMPNYIYNAFVSTGIITLDECDAILEKFRNVPKVNAAFSTINIELEIEDALEVKIKDRLEISANFDLNRISSFNITNATGKELPNRDLIILDSMLDQIKDKHWDDYKKGLRRAYIITELYYGKVEIKIDTDVEIDFEAAIPASKLQAANKLKFGRTITYSFESLNVPFAMRLKRVKHFNN